MHPTRHWLLIGSMFLSNLACKRSTPSAASVADAGDVTPCAVGENVLVTEKDPTSLQHAVACGTKTASGDLGTVYAYLGHLQETGRLQPDSDALAEFLSQILIDCHPDQTEKPDHKSAWWNPFAAAPPQDPPCLGNQSIGAAFAGPIHGKYRAFTRETIYDAREKLQQGLFASSKARPRPRLICLPSAMQIIS